MRRTITTPLLITLGLLVAFYAGVLLLPRIVRGVASRSIYNYRTMAEEAIARKDYDMAVTILERAKREVPREIYRERPEFMEDWIGRIRQKQGRTTESLQAFLRAQKGFFRNIQLRGYLPPPRLVTDIIHGYLATGNRAGAYHEALTALDFYPMMSARLMRPLVDRANSDPRIMRDLALLAMATERNGLARDRLRRSLRHGRNLPETRYWLGRLAESENDVSSATVEYEAELALFPYAENALARLIAIARDSGGDVRALLERRKRMHDKAIVQFLSTEPSQPLAGMFGINGVNSVYEQAFDLDQSGSLLINIVANSTPCHGLFGWVEVQLDGRHFQTIYVRDPLNKRGTLAFHLWTPILTAGKHTLRIQNLSDAMDGREDRNVFLHAIRIYRVTPGNQNANAPG